MGNLASLKQLYGTPEALREHLTGYLTEYGLSLTRVEKESGVSSSAISQFLRGKYAGDNESVAEKLIIWLASRDRRIDVNQTLASHNYTATDTSERIIKVLAFAQIAADVSVIYGGAGVGKTKTIRHYASVNPNVWVTTMRPDTAGVAACLEEIGEAVGVRANRANRLSREIGKRLEDTRGLLVIDEAQHLTTPAIEAVRSIHDSAEIGLVLSGNESVYGRLTGGSRAANFAQLFSRVGKKLRLTRPTRNDVNVIEGLYNITGTTELSTLFSISQKPGALRGMVKVLRLAVMLSGGESLSPDHITAAWRDLGGE